MNHPVAYKAKQRATQEGNSDDLGLRMPAILKTLQTKCATSIIARASSFGS